MKIRQATPKDAEEIIKIMISLNINRTDNTKPGFVEYPIPTKPELLRRIEENPLFFTGEHESRVIGFSAAYTDSKLAKEFLNDEIARHILTKPNPLIYWDQLAMAQGFQNTGRGLRLARHFLEQIPANYEQVWGAICHEPIKNPTIIRITEEFLGLKLEEEIPAYNGLVFGIYKKEI